MRMISERISIDETNFFSLVILGKVERWKESLLLFWLMSWTFCGSVFLFYFFTPGEFQYSIPMMIMIGFWLYFEFRTLKVFLWRRKGFERVVFEEENILYQKVGFANAKKISIQLENVSQFEHRELSDKNFFSFLEKSFWVLGGERILMDNAGQSIPIAMQINDLEVRKTLSLLNGQLKKSKRDLRQKQRTTSMK